MQVDALSRKVRLSVRELAAFRNRPRQGGSASGRWRAQLGQKWHQVAAARTRATDPEAQIEYTVNGLLLHRGWTFQVQGRIDQIFCETSGATTLREVKTVRTRLPCPQDELLRTHPEYFAQASIYLRLARYLPEFEGRSLRAELLFIEIDSGAAQPVPLDTGSEDFAADRLDELCDFLEDRRVRSLRIRQLNIRPAFPSLREGQPELIDQLARASLQSSIVLMQAPTGFGKTGLVLEHALQKIRDGSFERGIYLTSKSSGQIETVRQLQSMLGSEGLRYVQMRNRSEHRIDSVRHRCTGDSRCDDGLEERWIEAGIRPTELFSDNTLRLADAKKIGAETGICPYTLTKSCLPSAEFWIGDSNYLFAPGSRNVFSEVQGFDPAKTILIIDEAHNLPARNAEALSVELDASDLLFAIEELRAAGAAARLIKSLETIAEQVGAFGALSVLNAQDIYTIGDFFETSAGFIDESWIDSGALNPFVLDLLRQIPELADKLGSLESDWLYWFPRAGLLRAQCLNAGKWTAECLQPFGSTVLMSATLEPIQNFHEEIGISPEETSLAIGWADWRESAYDVAVDCRVDTRMRERERHYETTARTISQMAHCDPGQALVAFFPSYLYATNIQNYLSVMDSSLRIAVQPRGVSLDEQSAFINESLLLSDALFLILGSSYAEGIDQLGGRVRSVIVVGPGLPEVNPVQKAKMELAGGTDRAKAFEEVYLIPAMRKIHQALGRIVRAPGQRARVLLHCKRFADAQHKALLQTEYQTGISVKNESDLLNWLTKDHRSQI